MATTADVTWDSLLTTIEAAQAKRAASKQERIDAVACTRATWQQFKERMPQAAEYHRLAGVAVYLVADRAEAAVLALQLQSRGQRLIFVEQ